LTGALLAAVCPAAAADSSATVQNAERYLAKGDRNSALIELGNAVRESPDDPSLRAGLARVYLEEGRAEEDGAAGTRSTGPQRRRADYLPILADVLLVRWKFAGLLT